MNATANLRVTKTDPKTAVKSATFQRAAAKRVIDADTGERVGWMRPYMGEIEWSAFHLQGFEPTEAEALKAIEAAVIEHRGFEADASAYADEVMALPEPARTARRNRDKAAVLLDIERGRNIIRPVDLELAEARFLIAEAELADAMTIIDRRAA